MAIYGSSLFLLGILACQLCLSAKKRNIGRCRHAAAGHDLPLPGCQDGDPVASIMDLQERQLGGPVSKQCSAGWLI